MPEDWVRDWVARYERAWRTAGTGGLAGLFTTDAEYRPDPYAEPLRGLAAIRAFWDAERAGPDEVFALTFEVVAQQGRRAVVRVHVGYGDPPEQEYRDLWIVTVDGTGRATAFEEWPFFPGQLRAVATGGRST